MKVDTKRLFKKSVAIVTLFCMATQTTFAALLTLAQVPLFIGATPPPQVMLTISKDQQMHYKAYTDYADLDGDGLLDITYKHTITYYGYFDPIKCYNYDTGLTRFVPMAESPGRNKYCDEVAGDWSGNFLNWVAMSRLDTIRKLLYGGFRSTDTANLTVLERSLIPPDAHAWVKYYNGNDINKLTPHNPPIAAPSGAATGSNSAFSTNTAQAIDATTPKHFRNVATSVCIGDQVKVETNSSNHVVGRVSAVDAGNCSTAGTGTFSLEVDPAGVVGTGAGSLAPGFYTVSNLSGAGISFCNVTSAADGGRLVGLTHVTGGPPLIRVARGNFAMWANNEVVQCEWNPGTRNFGGVGSNGNIGALSGSATLPVGSVNWASAFEPFRTTHGLLSGGGAVGTQDMVVRVEVCNAALLGSEKCKQYNQTNVFKPIGLLQQYGDPNLIHFGLMSNSYAKNKSGGVLRKNVGTLNNEIAVDGTFLNPTAGSIIASMNALKIFGYSYSDDNYNNGDNCGVVTSTGGNSSLNRGDFEEGRCTNWGDPIAEMYLESVRYFAGKAATADYEFKLPGSRDAALGLPKASWTDPLNNNNFCAPLNVVVFNPGVASYDRDQLGGVSDIAGVGANTAITLTNAVGAAEGINGNAWFVGNSPADPSNLCTGKSNVMFGDIFGLCPQSPRGQGTYLIAGIAHHARTNRIRSDIAVPSADAKSLKVTTYGIAAASSPNVRIPVGSSTITLMPSARFKDSVVGWGSGGLVDFKVVFQNATSGKFFVQWEASQQGADYDLDVAGVISYTINTGVSPPTITVTTDVIGSAATGPIGFGYIINGTTKDGAHFHSGAGSTNPEATTCGQGFPYDDPTSVTVTNAAGVTLNGITAANCTPAPPPNINASGGCNDCFSVDPPTSVTYTLGTSAAKLLEDPLWYAAKYGGFTDGNGNNLPDVPSEWDSRLTNGQFGQDGIPDNFFLVANPLGLEGALARAFQAILEVSSASSVAANSTQLQTGTTIYQARFNTSDWSGQLLAFPVDPATGQVSPKETWDAGQVINGQNHSTGRNIFTYNDTAAVRDGIRFRWPAGPTFDTTTGRVIPASLATNEISPTLVDALNILPGTSTSDARGQERLNWLRGDPSSEGPTGTAFRQRLISKLGDIVNSSPTFVGAPDSGFGDPGYAAFRSQQLDRNPMIYVAANEGMMHGFRASDGVELLAYIPSKVHSRLNQLTSKTYVGSAAHRYYVDATPTIGDAFISVGGPLEWRTVLVSSLGAGGQGLFALDVTNPGKVGNPADAGDFAETNANAAKVALWEFNDSDDPNLGYIIGQPIIRKMANDRWAAIVSGGYNNSEGKTPDNPAVLGEAACTDSTGVIGAVTSATVVPPNCTTSSTGQAYLFIIFLDGPTGANRTWINGTDYIRIPTGAGSVGTPNGLASPAGLDTNIDGKVDFIYAGDLLGNLFKFDVRSPTPGNWANPTNQVVLFTATVPGTVPPQPQPITSIPDGTLHPTGKGFIIAFGTGKYLEPADPNAPYAVQSYYGIWDKNDALVPPAVASPNPISTQTTVTSRTQLLEQTITNVTSGGTSFRVLSNNVPVWSQDTSPPVADDSPSLGRHMGWFMNFPNAATTGERSVFGPILTGGRLIFTTLLPNAAACEAGGSSFLMVVSPGTGGRIDAPVLETNNDGTLNSSDKVLVGSAQVFVSGVQTKTGITNTPTIIKAGAAMGGPGLPGAAEQTGSATAGATADPRVAIMGGSKVSNIASELIGFGATSGRVSWREILAE